MLSINEVLPTPATPNPAAVFALPGILFTTLASRKAYAPRPVKPKAPVILHGRQSTNSFSSLFSVVVVVSLSLFVSVEYIFYGRQIRFSFQVCYWY